VDVELIERSIIKPLMTSTDARAESGLADTLMNRVLLISDIRKTDRLREIVESVTYGDTVLYMNGEREALILNTRKFQIRSVEEPNNEKTLSGPREGFTESLIANLSLVRRKIRSNDLKMRYYTIGKRTKTAACICYIESLAKKQIIDELYRRLDRIDIDGVLDSNYVIEMIKDSPYSPFASVGFTERPDVTVGRLLEGRIALFIDGTPVVITVPHLFIENLQSSEDYYLNYTMTSFNRILRIIALILTTTVPSLYISVVAFHHEMIPTNLIISISSARKTVPLPAAVECVIMLGVFELIKETGARMPTNTGQALSIVGALVIGEAAVQARLVAAPMIIVVSITGISSLIIPKMSAAVIYMRILLLILSTMFGFYGFILGSAVIVIHVLNLRSFGIPQVALSGYIRFQNVKDIAIRVPWFRMNLRPKMLSDNPVRMVTDDAQSED
jgi:spore germination protein KA